MNFRNFLEMASFTLPHFINLDGEKINAIDMQFELSPKTINKNGKTMNQGSKFIAKMPNSNNYLAYDGKGYSFFTNKDEIIELLVQGYEKIPNDWWQKARFI
jgi:hypothetical protein